MTNIVLNVEIVEILIFNIGSKLHVIIITSTDQHNPKIKQLSKKGNSGKKMIFTDAIIYIENPGESTDKLLELV
jgi:hypothetical protein